MDGHVRGGSDKWDHLDVYATVPGRFFIRSTNSLSARLQKTRDTACILQESTESHGSFPLFVAGSQDDRESGHEEFALMGTVIELAPGPWASMNLPSTYGSWEGQLRRYGNTALWTCRGFLLEYINDTAIIPAASDPVNENCGRS
ncbi:hypothetical protein K0M31_007847 [Melipona bicolor]|uniref:Uncharacterized protein n=1 Tax=Melipona bicolor TaxID=60889 RepID=A0AA40KW47_9HYME|nr:hypothetical protein K0M31_007847 [Melipona bicolor]